jgi:hypothetical protein
MGLESRQNPWPIITPPDVGGKEYLTLLWVFSNIGYKAEGSVAKNLSRLAKGLGEPWVREG